MTDCQKVKNWSTYTYSGGGDLIDSVLLSQNQDTRLSTEWPFSCTSFTQYSKDYSFLRLTPKLRTECISRNYPILTPKVTMDSFGYIYYCRVLFVYEESAKWSLYHNPLRSDICQEYESSFYKTVNFVKIKLRIKEYLFHYTVFYK